MTNGFPFDLQPGESRPFAVIRQPESPVYVRVDCNGRRAKLDVVSDDRIVWRRLPQSPWAWLRGWVTGHRTFTFEGTPR